MNMLSFFCSAQATKEALPAKFILQ